MKVMLSCLLSLAVFVGCTSDYNGSRTIVGLSGITQNYDGSEESWRKLLNGAKESGVTFLHLQTPPWSETEIAPGSFNFSYFDNFFKLEEEYQLNYTIDIATPLGLGEVNLPSDMAFVSFDDPVLARRYNSYIIEVMSRFPKASHVVLHTETVGAFFGNDATREDFIAFCRLISDAVEQVHSAKPGTKVGIYGTTQESKEILDCLNQSTDFFGISYIADHANLDHASNIEDMVTKADNKKLAFVEVGIPTASLLEGSEQSQVDFVNLVFDFAELYGHRIEFVSYYQYIDEDESITSRYVPVLFPNFGNKEQEELIAFLSSLGLQNADGRPKSAWSTFKVRVPKE